MPHRGYGDAEPKGTTPMTAPTRIRTTTHPWTAPQDEQLRMLARANTPPADIASRLSRTPEQVFERAHELGVTLGRRR